MCPEKVSRAVERSGNKAYEKHLREPGVFSLEKRGLGRGVYQFL